MGSSQSKNNNHSTNKRKSVINTRTTKLAKKNKNTAGIVTNNTHLNNNNNKNNTNNNTNNTNTNLIKPTNLTTSIINIEINNNNYTTPSTISLQNTLIKPSSTLDTQSLMSIGIDMYTTGTPSNLIKDHLAVQPLSSLFPTDTHLTNNDGPQSTITSLSSNSSSFTEISDLFSNISIETPNSTLSSISGHTKYNGKGSYFNDGLSSTLVTPINEDKTPTIRQENDLAKQVTVAQSKIYSGDQSIITDGFIQLTYLAETQQCVEAYYPLAECYYLGHHDPTSHQPDIQKSFYWFSRLADLPPSSKSAIPSSTIAWAQYRIAMMLAKGDNGIDPDAEKALYYFLLSADKDNKCAQYMVGLHYQYGLLSNQNPDIKSALYWFNRAACQGFSDAQVSLSQLVLDHLNVFSNNDIDSQNKLVHNSIQWLELASKQNNTYAHLYLGGIYDEGELIPKDAKKAMYHYESALSTNDDNISNNQVTLAHYFVGINYRIGKLVNQDNVKAVKHLTKAALNDYAPAQRAIGLMYLEGIGLVKNEKTAFDWITKSAMQGDIQSIGILGQLAEQGRGCKINIESAIHFYSKAASSGSILAKLSLANILLKTGHYTEAYPWYESVANDDLTLSTQTNQSTHSSQLNSKTTKATYNIGHVKQRNTARLMLAHYKYNGWGGIPIDRSLAYREYKYLSDVENHPEAHYWVGACYEEGIKNQDTDGGAVLVKRDIKKAFDYYLKCAQSGYVKGEFQVAFMLANGCYQEDNDDKSKVKMVIEKDPTRAFKWYHKAAEHGYATAQYSLGMFYELGLSPIPSIQLKEAKLWYERSAKQQNTRAMIALAQLLLQESDEFSHKEALKWLQLATKNENDENYTVALRSLASVFEKGNVISVQSDPQRYETALRLLEKAATKKDPLAFVEMARYYEQGLGMKINLHESILCLIQSEKLGYKKAKMAIADLYYRNKMWDKAIESYDPIINSNPILTKPGWTARLNMSKLLLLENIPQDVIPVDYFQKIFSWLQTMVGKAVGLVAIEPLELLGLCFEYGNGVKKDVLIASSMYEKATLISTEEMNWVQERTRFRLIQIHMQLGQYKSAWNHLQKATVYLNEMNHLNRESREIGRTIRFFLGYLLLHGEQKNIIEAKKWLIQAADEGEGNASLELARISLSENDIKTARSRLEQGRESVHSGCMLELALLIEQSEEEDEEDDNNEIIDLLEHAMKLGNIQATYHRGRLYHLAFLENNLILENAKHALHYYSIGAEKEDRSSMIRMGQLYCTLERHQDAKIWFEKVQDEPISIIMLAMYQLQSDVYKNQSSSSPTSVAFEEFNMLTKKYYENHKKLSKMDCETISTLCFFLGQHYNNNNNNNNNNNKSLAQLWYKRAAECNEHKLAMYQLGLIYEENDDYENAKYWFHTAAEKKNYVKAYYKLGLYHAYGVDGLEINYVAAQKYFGLAQKQGDEESSKELVLVKYKQALDTWNNKKQYQNGLKQLEDLAKYVPEASLKLGDLYHHGFSNDNNHSDGFEQEDICVIRKNYKQASEYYTYAAKNGNSKAAMIIGSFYENGYIGDDEDDEDVKNHYHNQEFKLASLALEWYENAYQKNHGPLSELAIARMKYKMAEILLRNNNLDDVEVALDLQEDAYIWFETCLATSSELLSLNDNDNNSNEEDKNPFKYAQVMISLYYLNGWGRKEKNPKKGFSMLLELIQEDDHSGSNIRAITEVAMCYEQGIYVNQNINQALIYWETAAKLNDVDALRRIAEIYRLGLTGEYNIEKADHYYNRAEIIEMSRQNECDKSVYSISSNSSSSSSYVSRRASMNSFNSQ
ncbi:unnamed protein product [Cunninghamella blakesleeana]